MQILDLLNARGLDPRTSSSSFRHLPSNNASVVDTTPKLPAASPDACSSMLSLRRLSTSALLVALAWGLNVASASSVCGSIINLSLDGTDSTTLLDGVIASGLISLDASAYDTPPSQVSISAPGITFDQTLFSFTKGSNETYQHSVSLRTDGGSPAALAGSTVPVALNFQFTMDSIAQKLLAPCTKQIIHRQLVGSGRGAGSGDPHLNTLDNVRYDFQTPGVFRWLQSRNLLVQTFQHKCVPVAYLGARGPSCYQGVAVAFADSVVRLMVVNGAIVVQKGSAMLDWLSVEKLNKADGYRIFLAVDQATYVDVTLSVWTNSDYPYLNVAVQMSPYFKDPDVTGLMGNWNGNPADDMTDTTWLGLLHGVSLSSNLFTCNGDDCAPFLSEATATDVKARTMRSVMTYLHQAYTAIPAANIPMQSFQPTYPGAPSTRSRLRRMEDQVATNGSSSFEVDHDAAGFPDQDSSSQDDDVDDDSSAAASASAGSHQTATGAGTVAPASSYFEDLAEELCNDVITQIPICGKYILNPSFYIDSVCVSDSISLHDLTVVDNTKLNYLRDCRRELDTRIEANASTPFDMQQLLTDRATLALGDTTRCASNCNQRGICLAAGCQCNSGFTGYACEIVIPDDIAG